MPKARQKPKSKLAAWLTPKRTHLVCERLGVSRQTVFNWREGRHMPRGPSAQALYEMARGKLSLRDIVGKEKIMMLHEQHLSPFDSEKN